MLNRFENLPSRNNCPINCRNVSMYVLSTSTRSPYSISSRIRYCLLVCVIVRFSSIYNISSGVFWVEELFSTKLRSNLVNLSHTFSYKPIIIIWPYSFFHISFISATYNCFFVAPYLEVCYLYNSLILIPITQGALCVLIVRIL